jgi:signal transduction histidine kinase
MLRSLSWKLILAFMLVAFTTAGLVALFIRLTSADRLMEFVIEQQRASLVAGLSDYYAINGSWDGVDQNWQQLSARNYPPPAGQSPEHASTGNPPPGERDRRNLFGLADTQGSVIISVDPHYPAGAQLPADVLKAGTPITVNGEQVGTIINASQPGGFNPQEALFLQRTSQALLFAILGALVVALIMGILLARTLTGPLHELTNAAQRITQGQLEQQVRVKSNDEIGQLAIAFNRMSQEVARVNQARRQMTADIAHDLRTPLTVISGYIEAMRDGVLKPTPQRLALIYTEIERLQDLVGDLKTLSLADAGELSLNPQFISPRTLLDRAANLFSVQAEHQIVSIRVEASEDLPKIFIDEARMMQVLGNLISNAFRYTSSEGAITLSAQISGDKMEINVKDTGTGIAEEELPYIFDRFHRADKSRHTETGESGLGLAIVKALVESHGGTASADSVLNQGTTIHLYLPIQEPSSEG